MNLLHEQLVLISTQFHWLRPAWLLGLLPILLLSILLWRQKRHSHQWQNLIAPELLPFLIDGKTIGTKKSLLWALIIAWLLSTIALAGPSWVKRPTPIEKNQDALVILLDLSISMMSEDIKPSRIARARLKITDILRERKDGQTALVVYAGEAHTVTPLSDDSATVISLLPSLQPNIMPLGGSNTEDAIQRGIQLLNDAGATQGDLLLVTDGVVPEAFPTIRQLLANKNIHLKILGVGSNQPAPIAGGNGGFLRDKQGAIITTQLNSNELSELAKQVSGRYRDIANTNSDINYLMGQDEQSKKNQPTLERDFDQWFDQGYWLIFILLPLALFSFKRGIILTLIFIPVFGLTPKTVYAFELSDFWLTKDQQAQQTLKAGDAKKAADQFESPEWKASAQYRAGDYVAAAENFAKSDSASAHYNQGNALAKSGNLDGAIKAYDEALKRDANLEDAKKNRALVEKALKQKKEQEKKEQENKDKQSSDKKDQNKQEQNKDNQDQNKNDQDQNKDKQDNNSSGDQKDSKDQNKDGEKNQNNEQNKPENSTQQNSSTPSDSDRNQNSAQQSSANASAANKEMNQESSAANQNQSATTQGQQSSSTAAMNQQSAQNSSNSQDDKDKQQATQQAEADPNQLTDEQKQAVEQWLRRVPDDPGGLLRNKFRWQYQQNRQKKADGEFEPPKNNADQRW